MEACCAPVPNSRLYLSYKTVRYEKSEDSGANIQHFREIQKIFIKILNIIGVNIQHFPGYLLISGKTPLFGRQSPLFSG